MNCNYVAITLRNDYIDNYGYYNDYLHQKWYKFLLACDLIPILLPNNLNIVKDILKKIKFKGIILSGGGNIISKENDERVNVEKLLYNYSIHKSIPLIGVCRGMQQIFNFNDISITEITNHVATQHVIKSKLYFLNNLHVNSYHRFGVKNSEELKKFNVIAESEDNVVEAINYKNIFGLMWHPERDEPFLDANISLFKRIFLYGGLYDE